MIGSAGKSGIGLAVGIGRRGGSTGMGVSVGKIGSVSSDGSVSPSSGKGVASGNGSSRDAVTSLALNCSIMAVAVRASALVFDEANRLHAPINTPPKRSNIPERGTDIFMDGLASERLRPG